MKIAFAYTFNDADWLGGRNYYSSLFDAIRTVARNEIELVLVTGRKTLTSLPEQFPRLQVIRTPLLDRNTPEWVLRQFRRLPSGRTRDPQFADFLRKHRIDVLSHSGGLGAGSGIRSLGWLPDFQFVRFPEYWTPKQLRGTHRLYRSTCMSCDALLLSSRSALADLKQFAPWCDVPAHVLHFVSLPVNVGGLRSLEDVQSQYGIPNNYVHLPNQFWAHKNHRVVVDALALLKQRGVNVTVVCTGQTIDVRRPDHFDALMTHCRLAGVSDNFKVLGMVPYADMQALMLHARCVVNPSRFEGWSTTVEEAKTLGKQVLLSDIPVHREQAPQQASYFPPDDAPALSELLCAAFSTASVTVDAAAVERNHAERLRSFGEAYMAVLR